MKDACVIVFYFVCNLKVAKKRRETKYLQHWNWQGRAGQGREGQGRAGQGRAGQGTARRGRAGKSK